MSNVLFVFLFFFFFVIGGEVCRIGGRWVVNPSGGLESKGTFNQLLAKRFVSSRFRCIQLENQESLREQ